MGARNEDFVISRVFAAPPALVFAAWTDAKHLAAWFGPHGFTGRAEVDARAGGAFRIVIIASNGVELPLKGRFLEIVPNQRIVYTSDMSDHPDEWHDRVAPERDRSKPKPAYECETTVTFAPIDDKTLLKVRVRFPSADVRARFAGMDEGWSQGFEKLAARLAGEEPSADVSAREIRSSRLFAAPRELVWKMWTEREHIGKWYGPNGFRLTIHTMDVRPGGVWDFVMHGPDGRDYVNKVVYLELDEPSRLVYSHVNEPFHHTTVSLTSEGDKTRLHMRMLFESAKLREWVAKEHGAVEGQQQTLDRLEELLLAR